MSRYKPFLLAKDYPREVAEKGKCILGTDGYIPLFNGVNFSSKGFRTCAWSFKEKRQIETMSEIEYYTFLVLESTPTVKRIYEQYGLNPIITQEEAARTSYDHPQINGKPIIMSTDFITDVEVEGVRCREGISCKKKQDYDEDPRVAEKAVIEAQSLAREDIKFRFQFDTELPMQLVKNANYVVPRYGTNQLPCDESSVAFIAAWLTPYIELGQLPLATLCKQADRCGLLPEGTALAVALHLIARRFWPVDMRQPIAGHLPLPLIDHLLGEPSHE